LVSQYYILRWDLPGVFVRVLTCRDLPTAEYIILTNQLLAEHTWGYPGRLKLYDKNSGEIPAEYIILTNQLLAEHTWGDPETLMRYNAHVIC
jgi:hypothetical protein